MWRLAFRNITTHKLRTLLISLAVSAGVAFMAGSYVLTATMNAAFDDVFTTVYRNTDVVVRGKATMEGTQGASDQRPRIDGSLLDRVRGVDGVQEATGDIMSYAQVTKTNGDAIGDPANGAPTFGGVYYESALSITTIVEGSAPERPDEILIDKATAEKGDLKVGDRTTVLTRSAPEQFVISGIVRFGSTDSLAGSSYTMFMPETAERLFGSGGKFDEIAIKAKPGLSQEQLRDRVATVIPAEAEALTGKVITKEMQNALKDALSFFTIFLTVFGLIALFVGAFTINNVFSIIVAQRQRESALLRAVGATRRQVLRSIVVEAFFVGVVSAVVGFIGGVGLAAGLKALLSQFGVDLPGGGVVITSTPLIISIVAGIGVTVVSAWLPARAGSRVPPIAALRDVSVDQSAGSLRRLITGSVVTAVGAVLMGIGLFGDVDKPLPMVGGGLPLVFIGVAILGPIIARPFSRVLGAPLPALRGVTGRLAKENAARNPKRTARTAAALMIGLTLVVFISVVASSAKMSINEAVDKSFSGDFVIEGPQTVDAGLSPELAQSLRKLPEVSAVSPIRIGYFVIDGGTKYAAGIDPVSFSSILDLGVKQGSLERLGESQIAISQDVADSKKWALGHIVPITFASGQTKPFTVGAIFEDKSNILGPYAISIAAWDANVENRYDMMVMVNKAKSVTADQARAAIEPVLEPYPTAKLQDQTEYKESVAKQINQLLNFIIVLLAMAVSIALLGIVCTLWLSVIERTREIGLMRAVGMTRRQVRAAVRWESVIVCIMGALQATVLGVVFGWALQQALKDEGITSFSLPVGFVIGMTLVAALLGIVAAAWPARRAARLNILEAISTE